MDFCPTPKSPNKNGLVSDDNRYVKDNKMQFKMNKPCIPHVWWSWATNPEEN